MHTSKTQSNEAQTKEIDFAGLAQQIKLWAKELGFQQAGICDTDLGDHETHFLQWLKDDFHGEMDYMQRHGTRRSRPADLEPGTTRIISVRMDYLPQEHLPPEQVLDDHGLAYISRYALGRDYHKVLRKRLQKLADRIEQHTGPFGYRAYTDSAPVLEKAIAQKSGLGWIGKHSNLLNKDAGSWFFLGELYTNLPLPCDEPETQNHCGSCTSCMDVCPTQAIVAPYRVDARRCISYLTIELKTSIPEDMRPMLGNRIYGCDDCQLVCPWNRFAKHSQEIDFSVRHSLDSSTLCQLFLWTEAEFLRHTEGSAIRRIGYLQWRRNIAVALGNAEYSNEVTQALNSAAEHPSDMLREHVSWAINQQLAKASA